MKALIIDTSLDISYIILLDDKQIIILKKLEKTNLSKELFISLKNVLSQTKTNFSDLSFIATSQGPGSFTSLRVSASICKAINFAKKIPLIGYPSLKAYAPNISGPFLVAIDAKSQGAFIIEAKLENDKIEYLSDTKLFTQAEAAMFFDKHNLIISPDAEVLKEKFEKYQNKFLKTQINPHHLIELIDQKFLNKEFEDFNSFNLLYLRGPSISKVKSH